MFSFESNQNIKEIIKNNIVGIKEQKDCENKCMQGKNLEEQIYICLNYYLGEKKKIDYCFNLNEKNNHIFSYDPGSHNFHIVPKEREKYDFKEINEGLKNQGIVFLNKYGKELDDREGPLLGVGYGRNAAKNHLFNYCHTKEGDYGYIIALDRFWVCGNRIININNGIQFFRYKWESENINWENNAFDMMYPRSGEDGFFCWNTNTGHCVYNPPQLSIIA